MYGASTYLIILLIPPQTPIWQWRFPPQQDAATLLGGVPLGRVDHRLAACAPGLEGRRVCPRLEVGFRGDGAGVDALR